MKKYTSILLFVISFVLMIAVVSPAAANDPINVAISLDTIGCAELATDFNSTFFTPNEPVIHSTIVESGGLVYMDQVFGPVKFNGNGIWTLFNSDDRGLQTATFPIPSGQPINIYIDVYDLEDNLLWRTYIQLSDCNGGNISGLTWSDYEQLLANGGFELPAPTVGNAKFWTGKNLDNDKRVCNKDKTGDGDTNDPEDKIVAALGECAFQFRGLAGLKSQIQQVWKNPLGSAGNFVVIGANAEAKNLVNARYVARFKYADGTKDKVTFTFPAGSYAYQGFGMGDVTTGPVENVKTSLIINGPGKIRLDKVSTSVLQSSVIISSAPIAQHMTAFTNVGAVGALSPSELSSVMMSSGNTNVPFNQPLELPQAPSNFRN